MVKVGDLIRVREGTNDFRARDGDVGIVINVVWTRGLNGPGLVPGVVEIAFISGQTLRFHQKWLEVIVAHQREADPHWDEINDIALSLADAL